MDARDALALVVALWRETRDPDVADLVELFGEQAAPESFGLDGTSRDHPAWLERAAQGHSEDLTPLLATLDATGRADQAVERLRAVLERGPDPRTVRALTRWIVGVPYPRSRPFWDLVLRAFTAWAPANTDTGALSRRVIADRDDGLRAPLARIVNGLRPRGRVARIEGKRRDPVAAWIRRGRGRPAALEELLWQVMAEPEADDPREVLADYWMERGEARGHFTRLQLDRARREATDPQLAPESDVAERALLDAHHVEWFGPASAVAAHRTCARGFVESASLHQRFDLLDRARGAPWLGTVHTLGLPGAEPSQEERVRRFLADPILRNVRRLSYVDARWVALALEVMPALEEIGVVGEGAAASVALAGRDLRVVATDPMHLRVRSLVIDTPSESVRLLDRVAPEVERVAFRSLASVVLERAAGGAWRALAEGAPARRRGHVLPISLEWLHRLAQERGVALPTEPAAPTALYLAPRANADLRGLPPAPVVFEGRFGVPGMIGEIWGDAATLWRRAPSATRIGHRVRGSLDMRLTRRPDGRADVRATGRSLGALDEIPVARVFGGGPDLEAWCASRGVPLEPPE